MKIQHKGRRARRGTALLVAVTATVALAGMAAAILAVGGTSKKEHTAATGNLQALYVAEAGLSQALAAMTNGDAPTLGSAGTPTTFSNGSYWGTVVDNGDDTSTVTVYGTVGNDTRALEAVVQTVSEGVYSSALFAGNTSGDASYNLKFGGTGTQADRVTGNVYSGGNVLLTGTAQISGTVRAVGALSGVTGESGVSQPIPNLAGMNYAVNNNVNVAQRFATGGATYKSSTSYGGKAYQLPESDPAHIFRKNPNDRLTNINATTKDDYFLEDPYETINTSTAINASGGSPITIAGVGGEPGSSGNDMVYYIDGNLWVHNNNAFSFTLKNATNTPVRITIVVKGNIYISDNIFYQNATGSGLALIAMKDSSVTDSGNIYFGDPSFGTLEYMDAFMYAENNFLDNNLSASGSAKVTVHGNMTAGNQVKINRDYGSQHSKLTVNFDDRLWEKTLTLPGLPTQTGSDPTYQVVSWREVAVP